MTPDHETAALRREVDLLTRRIAALEELLMDLADPLRRYIARKPTTADLLPLAPATQPLPTVDGMAMADLTAELVGRFQKVTGRKYVHAGAKDAQAVKRLLALKLELRGELLARWEECLRMKAFPGTTSIALFAVRINDFGKKAAIPAPVASGDLYGT